MSDENTNPGEGEGIASLRKQYETTAAENKRLAERLATFEAKDRQVTVAGVLKAKGLPEKAASLYTGDDVSEDAVGKWVEQYGDVFGIKQQEGDGQPAVDPNAVAAARVANASFGAAGTEQFTPGQPVGDPEELLQLMNTLPFEKLVELKLLPDPQGGLYGRRG